MENFKKKLKTRMIIGSVYCCLVPLLQSFCILVWEKHFLPVLHWEWQLVLQPLCYFSLSNMHMP